jgi:hypothetical protein
MSDLHDQYPDDDPDVIAIGASSNRREYRSRARGFCSNVKAFSAIYLTERDRAADLTSL